MEQSTTPVFRPATEEDLETVAAMKRELYANDGIAIDPALHNGASRQLMAEPMFGGMWVMEAAREIAGYVVLTLGFSLEYGGRHGMLDELFVAADYRGRGWGTAAIRYIMAECARREMSTLLLEADLSNEKATRLYRRIGFREHHRRLMMIAVAPIG